MTDFLASVFGGGSQTAPKYSTIDPSSILSQFNSQDFDKAIGTQAKITSGVSNNNLDTYKGMLSSIDPNALSNLQSQSDIGSSLMSGNSSSLPPWLQTYMSSIQRKGAEGVASRGLAPYSGAGTSAIANYAGDRGMELFKTGVDLSNSARTGAQNIVNTSFQPYDINNTLLSVPALTNIAGENANILNRQAEADTAVENYNNNNSPFGNMVRTGINVATSLAGSFLGSYFGGGMKGGGGSGSSMTGLPASTNGLSNAITAQYSY